MEQPPTPLLLFADDEGCLLCVLAWLACVVVPSKNRGGKERAGECGSSGMYRFLCQLRGQGEQVWVTSGYWASGGGSRHTLAVTGRAAVGHGLGGEKSGSRSGLGALRLAPGDFLGAPRRRETMRRRITRGRCSRPARGTDPGRRGHTALPLGRQRWRIPFPLPWFLHLGPCIFG
jgi:hypothetical protein